MNLLFVESSRRSWGSEQHFVELAIGCQSAGHRVEAVVRAGSDVALSLQHAGVAVHATPFRGGADPRAMRVVWKTARSLKADWIVTDHLKHYWPLLLLARATGTRLAVFRHMAYIRGWLTRQIFPRLVDRFFVVSRFESERLACDGVCASRLITLYNPIDLGRFVPDLLARGQVRAELGLPAEAQLLGFIGRHDASKGVSALRLALSRAMDRDPGLHAAWVGEGPEWQATRDWVGAGPHADRHHFIPWTDCVQRYHAALDCLVCPSVIAETFGRVLAEAQACGVPVIARDRGGLPEAFDPGRSGLLWTDDDPETLAGLILEMLRDRQRRAAMGACGRAFVQRFSVPVIVAEFERLLLGGKQGQPGASVYHDGVAATEANHARI